MTEWFRSLFGWALGWALGALAFFLGAIGVRWFERRRAKKAAEVKAQQVEHDLTEERDIDRDVRSDVIEVERTAAERLRATTKAEAEAIADDILARRDKK